jgi:hypothetical protein
MIELRLGVGVSWGEDRAYASKRKSIGRSDPGRLPCQDPQVH